MLADPMPAASMVTPPEAPCIAARGLGLVYPTRDGGHVQALADVDLEVAERQFVTIVGPSGCGKTSLMRILCGLIGGHTGSVQVRGAVVRGPRRDVGIVFQDATLLDWRTVLANVMLPVDVLRLDRRAGETRARDLLALVGLAGFEARLPGELSGGMRQRVSIARALVHDPGLLLMDEPFGALDAMTREGMNLELLRIARTTRKTVVFITHSIQEAVFLGDRVVVMTPRPGRIALDLMVDLPHPRGLDLLATPEFGALTGRVRRALDARGLTA